MADEVRRSGRANKGHHTKNADALDEAVAAKPKPSKQKTDKKSKGSTATPARSQSAQSVQSADPEPEDDDDDDGAEEKIRCVCGLQEDDPDDGRKMICCDSCQAWQHNKCLHLPEVDSYWKSKKYYCELCRPEEHPELLAAIAKGEEPWVKWNKRGSKPPKSRTIDQKPVSKPADKASTATPQPTHSVPSPAPAHSDAPSPAPSAANGTPKEVATDDHAVKTETKQKSPSGEKRRLESTDKESASKKRRKPSAAKNDPSAAPNAATGMDALPPMHKQVAERLRDNFVPHIISAAESRGFQIPEGQTAQSIAEPLATEIIQATARHHAESGQGHEAALSAQLRSILSNTKNNPGLVDQLLSASLKPEDLATMSSEEMASEEKQREYAKIRAANEKQMILTEETGPRFRKTHKGDELVENEATSSHQQEDFKPPQPPQHDEKPVAHSPTQESHSAVELPEDIGRREPLAVDTTGGADSARRPSTNFDINSVFAQVRSPHNEQRSFIQRRQSSVQQQQSDRSAQVDADVDRLLKDEDGDVDMSLSDESIVWRGSLEMQHMEPCVSVARFVAGGDFGKAIPWTKLLSSTLPIAGRIEQARGDEYIQGLAATGSHDVAVLSLSPVTSEGRTIMDNLFKYFHDRTRWGVIPVDRLENEAVRDLYIIPVAAGPGALPEFMNLLGYCTVETPRKEDMLLLALVAKLPDMHAQPAPYPPQHDVAQTPTPAQPPNGVPGPSPSPLTNPHGPSYSPVGPMFPPNPYLAQQQQQQQPQAQPHNGFSPTPPQAQAGAPPAPPAQAGPVPFEAASAILGPYIMTPVVSQIMQNPVTLDMLYNLRDILDKVPTARDDLGVLSQYLFSKNGN